MKLTDLPANFVSNVRVDEITGCWRWVGTMNRHTPVYTPSRGKGRSARRYALEIAAGPTKLPFVTYTCDDETCVWPQHSQPVTGRRMIQLRRERGESLHGAVWRAKTTVAKRLHSKVGTIERAREIRRRVAAGESIVSVGRELGLHRATVFSVVHDMTWRESAPSALALIAQQAGMI